MTVKELKSLYEQYKAKIKILETQIIISTHSLEVLEKEIDEISANLLSYRHLLVVNSADIKRHINNALQNTKSTNSKIDYNHVTLTYKPNDSKSINYDSYVEMYLLFGDKLYTVIQYATDKQDKSWLNGNANFCILDILNYCNNKIPIEARKAIIEGCWSAVAEVQNRKNQIKIDNCKTKVSLIQKKISELIPEDKKSIIDTLYEKKSKLNTQIKILTPTSDDKLDIEII